MPIIINSTNGFKYVKDYKLSIIYDNIQYKIELGNLSQIDDGITGILACVIYRHDKFWNIINLNEDLKGQNLDQYQK